MPTRQRAHNSYLLEWGRHGFLFDPGEGAQRQMAFADVASSSITKILITHFHGDHCLGLPGLLLRMAVEGVSFPIEIYYPASGEERFGHLMSLAEVHEGVRVVPRPVSASGVVFEDEELRIVARPLDHRIDTWGYRVEEHEDVTMDPKRLAEAGIAGEAVGQLKRDGSIIVGERLVRLEEMSVPRLGQSVAFVMDTRVCDGAAELADKASLLVIESTYLESESHDAKKNGHLTAAQAAAIGRDMHSEKLILTHFSPRYPAIAPFAEEASEVHPDVVAVNDGDVIPLTRTRAGFEG